MPRTKKELPKVGTPLKYIDEAKNEFDAFVAGIDAEKGITIHLIDPEEAEVLGYEWDETRGNVKGEIFCINFSRPCTYTYATSIEERFSIVIGMIEKGVLDIEEFDFLAESVETYGAMSKCAFR